jgi:hypothetical protein
MLQGGSRCLIEAKISRRASDRDAHGISLFVHEEVQHHNARFVFAYRVMRVVGFPA